MTGSGLVFKNFDRLCLLAQPVLVFVLKISTISGKTISYCLTMYSSGEFASLSGCAGMEQLMGFGFEFLPCPSALI